MLETIYADIFSHPLDIQAAYDFVSDPAYGAVDIFIGRVRNHHEGRDVCGLTYDVHEGLAKKALMDLCAGAQLRWPKTKIYMVHYKGELEIGGISVIIAVGSVHRAESFEVCRHLIEELKKSAPIWKQEHYPQGKSAWLPGHSLKKTAHE